MPRDYKRRRAPVRPSEDIKAYRKWYYEKIVKPKLRKKRKKKKTKKS